MSPEQAAGEEVDSRSDLYALGVVAYEMLAGHAAVPGAQPRRRLQAHRRAARRRSSGCGPDARVRWPAAIMRALEKQPAERWQTRRGVPPGARRRAARCPRRRRRRRRRSLAAPAAAVALVGRRRSGWSAARPGRRRASIRGTRSWCCRSTTCGTTARWTGCATAASACWGSTCRSGTTSRSWTTSGCTTCSPGTARGRATTIGLDMARRLAREAGVWTVVLGDFAPGRRLAPSRRPGLRRGQRQPGGRGPGGRPRRAPTCGPLFDQLAAKLLDLSGAPNEVPDRPGPLHHRRRSRRTAPISRGVEQLNRWDLAGAERDLQRAIAIDTTFGLAYYKLALTRGWLVGTEDSIADARHRAGHDVLRQPAGARAHRHQRLPRRSSAASTPRRARCTSSSSPATRATPTPGTAWARPGSTIPPASNEAPHWTQAIRAFKRTLALDPGLRAGLRSRAGHAGSAAVPAPAIRAGGARFLRADRGRSTGDR